MLIPTRNLFTLLSKDLILHDPILTLLFSSRLALRHSPSKRKNTFQRYQRPSTSDQQDIRPSNASSGESAPTKDVPSTVILVTSLWSPFILLSFSAHKFIFSIYLNMSKCIFLRYVHGKVWLNHNLYWIFNSSGTTSSRQQQSANLNLLNQQLTARLTMTNPISSNLSSPHSSPASSSVGSQLKSKPSIEQSPSLRTVAIKQAASKQLVMGDWGDSLRWAVYNHY